MNPKPDIKTVIIYGLIIVLSLIALALVAVSPPDFMSNHVVYQGF